MNINRYSIKFIKKLNYNSNMLITNNKRKRIIINKDTEQKARTTINKINLKTNQIRLNNKLFIQKYYALSVQKKS